MLALQATVRNLDFIQSSVGRHHWWVSSRGTASHEGVRRKIYVGYIKFEVPARLPNGDI